MSSVAAWVRRHPILGFFVVFAIFPWVVPYKSLAAQVLIYGLFALGFNLLYGYTGLLSFGSRHITDESDHKRQQTEAGVRWRDAWVETKLTPEALAEAGVRAGSRVVPSAARKRPIRLGPDGEYVASYAIDDKASVAGLLELATRVKAPRHPVELVFTAREEIGCHGAAGMRPAATPRPPSPSR